MDSSSIIKLLSEGDVDAFEVIFNLYYAKLVHIAQKYLGSIADAEEIAQNVFMKIWENRSSLNKVENLNNYLFTVTKNACLDQLKHLKVKNSFSKNYYEERSAQNYLFIKDEAASSIIENELEKKISESIDLLPEKCKQVFVKSRYEGMKHAEIAKIFDISPKTVNAHISSALGHMRLHLKEYLTIFMYIFLI